MTKKTLYSQPFETTWAIANCLLIGLTLTFASIISYTSPRWEQSASGLNKLLSNGQVNFTQPDFSDVGRPRRRIGGGSW